MNKSPLPVSPPPRWYRWAVLVFISLSMFGNYYVYDSTGPIFVLLKEQLSFTDQQLGLLYTVYSIAAIVVLFVASWGWYFLATRPVSSQVQEQEFEITSGESLDQIISHLSREKLIRSRVAFKITVLRLGIAGKIQAGFFRLSPSLNAVSLARKLTRAYAKQVRVTLPEGLRRQEVALIVFNSLKEATSSTAFNPDEFIKLTAHLEGKLFPDTYDFSPSANAQAVASHLFDNYQNIMAGLKISTDKEPEILILASLLEREAANVRIFALDCRN